MFKVICFVGVIVISFLAWRRYNDKRMLPYLYLGVAGLGVVAWGYAADHVLLLPDIVGFISDVIAVVLGVIIAALFIGFGIKQTIEERRRKGK